MFFKVVLVFSCCALLLGATGCNNKSPAAAGQQAKNVAQANGNPAASVGSYASACVSSTLPDIGPIKFPGTRTFYELSSLEFTKKQIYYSDGNCTQGKELEIIEEKGDVNIVGHSNAIPGAVDEDFNFKSTTIATNSDLVTKAFNAVKKCGHNDWKTGTVNGTDVTTTADQVTCIGRKAQRTAPEVTLVENNTLYLGANAESSPETGRPAQVDRNLPFTKFNDPNKSEPNHVAL